MTGPRRTLHWLWAAALHCIGGVAYAKRRLAKHDAIIVLTLHRVLDDTEWKTTQSLPGMILRTETFRSLVAYVAKNFGTGGEQRGNKRLKICLTFDDGWIDTYTTAWPISRSFGIPITVFVCAGRMGCEMPFWPERAAELARLLHPAIGEDELERAIEGIKDDEGRLHRMSALAEKVGTTPSVSEDRTIDRTLSWQQLDEMAQAGVTVGSHGLNHRILTRITKGQAHWEMEVSKAAIEQELSITVTQFCYPNGNCSPELEEMAERCGYREAYSTLPGSYQDSSPRFAIPRINISENAIVGPTGRFSGLRFQYTVFWKAWRGDERRRAGAGESSASDRRRWPKLRNTMRRSRGAIAGSL